MQSIEPRPARADDYERRTVRITGRPDPIPGFSRGSRRPSRTAMRVQSRPDRVALWAVMLGVFLVFMAVVTAQADAAGWRSATLGDRTLERGDAGSDVRTLQFVLARKGYRLPATGRFGKQTHGAVKRFQHRRRLAADGVVGPRTLAALARPWTARVATWYGPGLFGNGLACGGVLRQASWGVAHRWLPCGARVPIAYAGRIIVAPVIDRGPFVRGIAFDLTQRSARALGMSATRRIRASY